MPKKQRANYFNFSGGLDTDASILSRKPITVTDIDNCNLNTDGSISSRRGIEANTLESAPVSIYTTYAPPSKVYEWVFKDDIGNDITIHVLQTYNKISFYIGGVPEGTPSLTVSTGINTLEYLDVAFEGNVAYLPYDLAPTYPYVNKIVKLVYTDALGLVTSPSITSKERVYTDIESVNKYNDFRTVCGSEHSNIHPLQEASVSVWTAESPVTTDNIEEYTFDKVYSATDRVQVTKGVFYIATASIPSDTILEVGTPVKIVGDTSGNTVYDKIRNIYTISSTTYAVLEGLPELDDTFTLSINSAQQLATTSPATYSKFIEVALGRIFMSIGRYPNRVYYSQIFTEDETKSHNFHTEANPYDPTDSDVVASDGGYFSVSGASYIAGIKESSGAIIVFAENGIWEAVGVDGIFKATDFVVRKLSDKGCISSNSIERIEGGILYVSLDGVNLITKDEKTGLTSIVRSLTDNKISEYFNDLSTDNKSVMSTTYNPIEKEIYILYNEDTETAPMIYPGTAQHYRNILIFKLKLGAWYKWSLSADTAGTKLSMSDVWMSHVNDSGRTLVVDDAADSVVDDAGTSVGILEYASATGSYQPLVYLTKYTGTNIENTYGKLLTTQVYDFEGTVDQEYNTPYFNSAHQTYADIMRGKIANYIKVFYKQLVDLGTDEHGIDNLLGGCNLRVSLDTASSPVNVVDAYGQSSQTNTLYGVAYNVYADRKQGYTHTTYKHKVLGRGNILQFIFSADINERFFKGVSTGTGQSPILDTSNTYWEEITEAELGSGTEWLVGATYGYGSTCKVTHPNHFHIVGWSCELIPTESTTTGQ